MVKRKSNRAKVFLLAFLVFLGVFGISFVGIQFITKTGIFRVPGVVYYSDELNETELVKLKEIFNEEVILDRDVTISVSESNERPTIQENEFLVDIKVPVADFYETRTDITEYTEDEYKYISIDELDAKQKLLSINDSYYLDDFTSGGIFRVLKFDSEKYDEEIKPLVEESLTKSFPEKDTVLTFAQTGVTALSRGMNKKLANIGGDATYFAENIKEFLSNFDLTHTSNESSFTSFASSANICSDTRFINTLTAIGLDIVELTGNHNQDCGDQAALDTIDTYEQNGIKVVGGGKTAEEAAKPLLLREKNTGITMLAYNESTGGATYDNTPGANQYYEENAIKEIAAAKERGDLVIVDVQYYECNWYDETYEITVCDYADSSAGDQIGLFRHLIDLGADIVVGTSAHQAQTFELYGNGVIYYGLGNLFFDQIWWPGTTRSLVLGHYFYNGKLLQTKITPTVYDDNMQTKVLDKETAAWFLGRLVKARP